MQSPIPSPLALARAQPRRRSARPCHSREAAQGRADAAARAPTPRAPRPAGPALSLPHSPRAGRAAAPGALHARPRRCHGPASRRSVAAEPAAAPPPRPARGRACPTPEPPEGGARWELPGLPAAQPRVPPHHGVSAAQPAPLPQVLQDAGPLPPGDAEPVLLLRGVRDQHRRRLPGR